MSDGDKVTRPILLMVSASIFATVFYTVVFSLGNRPVPIDRPWQFGVIASIVLNWSSIYCDKEGQPLPSYLAGIAGLGANLIFAACAFGMLLGSQSAVYQFMFSPR